MALDSIDCPVKGRTGALRVHEQHLVGPEVVLEGPHGAPHGVVLLVPDHDRLSTCLASQASRRPIAAPASCLVAGTLLSRVMTVVAAATAPRSGVRDAAGHGASGLGNGSTATSGRPQPERRLGPQLLGPEAQAADDGQRRRPPPPWRPDLPQPRPHPGGDRVVARSRRAGRGGAPDEHEPARRQPSVTSGPGGLGPARARSGGPEVLGLAHPRCARPG